MSMEREYQAEFCAVFHRTKDKFGGFSNMAGGYGYLIGSTSIPSSEHHYQAARYPDHPEVQKEILAVPSPLMAKRKAYEFISLTRPDWHHVNIAIMRHALQLRHAFNRPRLDALYEASGEMPIVEKSTRDPFWGAQPAGPGRLRGVNALGRLHMGHRRDFRADPGKLEGKIPAPDIPDYLLLGEPISHQEVPEGHAPPSWQPGLDL